MIENNIEKLHEELIKEMQLTPEEIIEYKKNNNMISKEKIAESRENVAFTLIKYFDATEEELAAFENALEDPRNDWTCDFEDELLPIFLEVRKQLNNK